MPKLMEGEEAGCRILPLCSEAGTGDCFAGEAEEAPTNHVSLSQTNPTPSSQQLPIIDVSSLPICNGTNGTPNIECRPSGGLVEHLIQLDKDEGGKFKYPKSNGFDLPELPECTGMNGLRKKDCRQIGRYSETGNWFVQLEGDDKKGEPFKYPRSYGFDLPELPECTGMNGLRKKDCR